jgi:hypothetical protein
MKTNNIKAFMAHLPEDQFEYLEEIIQEYSVIKYLIAHENDPYSHFHFVIEFEKEPDRNYHNLCKRVFKDKYNLRGQAKKGQPRQYGALKKIENIDKMCAYTLKDGNFKTNMSQDDIDRYILISRDNCKKLEYREKILKHLEEMKITNPAYTFFSDSTLDTLEVRIRKEIIRYVVQDEETNFKLTRNIIDNIYIEYLQKTKHLGKEDKIDALYFKFFSHY